MGIRRISEGTYKVRARIRLRGRIIQKQRTLTGTREESKALYEKMKAMIRAEDAGGSLTIKKNAWRNPFFLSHPARNRP